MLYPRPWAVLDQIEAPSTAHVIILWFSMLPKNMGAVLSNNRRVCIYQGKQSSSLQVKWNITDPLLLPILPHNYQKKMNWVGTCVKHNSSVQFIVIWSSHCIMNFKSVIWNSDFKRNCVQQIWKERLQSIMALEIFQRYKRFSICAKVFFHPRLSCKANRWLDNHRRG